MNKYNSATSHVQTDETTKQAVQFAKKVVIILYTCNKVFSSICHKAEQGYCVKVYE